MEIPALHARAEALSRPALARTRLTKEQRNVRSKPASGKRIGHEKIAEHRMMGIKHKVWDVHTDANR